MASDLDDELLALAESRDRDGRQRKKKRASNGTPKKRKADEQDSGSDMDVESEEDDWNPAQYPLEGKYIDEADRAKLLGLPEIQREEILAQREDEIQRWRDRVALEKLVKSQNGMNVDKEDSSAKRKPGARDKIDKYKAERRAKEERKQARRDRQGSPSSSPRKGRDRSDSSSEDEDGQYSKDDEMNARIARTYGEKPDRTITVNDLDMIRMSRETMAKYCNMPWFEKLVTGTFVRIVIGEEGGRNVYRICEVVKLGEPSKPYSLNGQQVKEMLELRHGSAVRCFNLERVSNTTFTDKEFDRLVKTCQTEKVKMPTLRDIERKAAEIQKLKEQRLNDADIDAILARKREMGALKVDKKTIAVQYGGLTQALALAQKRNDQAEVQVLRSKLAEIEVEHPEFALQREHAQAGQGNRDNKRPHSAIDQEEDLAAKINKRNRLANEESVRRAEAVDADRKRRDRKLKAEANASKMSSPRTGTPDVKPASNGNLAPLPVAPPSQSAASFDTVVQGIEVDLGDF